MSLRYSVKVSLTLVIALLAFGSSASAQLFTPGAQGSSNVKVMSHIPLGGPFKANSIDVEQELSRPYVYVSRRKDAGFHAISVKDPSKARILYSWQIENQPLHQGRALGAVDVKYLKTRGRYYVALGLQFDAGGPDTDLGAVIFDVTGLPDTSKVKEVGRIKAPDTPGGFHTVYSYKHSDGRVLLFTTTSGPHYNIYDMDKFLANGPNQGLIAQIPLPETPGMTRAGYHDTYVGYDPATKQDKFYGAGAGGYYVFDVTQPEQPKLLVTITGVAGMQRGHTFTPDPTGRYAVVESEYQYAPLRIIDLKPGLDGTVKNIARPIGAWTARWNGLAHNTEVRWPYVFVSAYEDGVQIFNMMDPTNPYTVGYYHTYDGPTEINKPNPMEPKAKPGEGDVDNGSFGIDVRNADGLVVTADMYTGFWAVKMDGFDGWNGHQWGMPNVSSAQDWDNGPEGAPKPQKVS
jgi:hypothetical protein